MFSATLNWATRPSILRSAGTRPMPRAVASGTEANLAVLPSTLSVPASAGVVAREAAGEVLAARADDAGNAEHLSFMQLEGDILEGARLAEAARFDENLLSRNGLARFAIIFVVELAPDHVLMHVLLGRALAGKFLHHLAVAHARRCGR